MNPKFNIAAYVKKSTESSGVPIKLAATGVLVLVARLLSK